MTARRPRRRPMTPKAALRLLKTAPAPAPRWTMRDFRAAAKRLQSPQPWSAVRDFVDAALVALDDRRPSRARKGRVQRSVFRWGWLHVSDEMERDPTTDLRTWHRGWGLSEMPSATPPGCVRVHVRVSDDDISRMKEWATCGIIATWTEPPTKRRGRRRSA